MKQQFKQVRFNILPDMEARIQERIKRDNTSFTIIIRSALELYLNSEDIAGYKKDTEISSTTGVLTQVDLDAIRQLLNSHPIVSTPKTPLFVESKEVPSEELPEDSGFLHKGLIMPTTGRLRGPDDPRRKDQPIQPGDTAMRKLKERGIEPYDVIVAKRSYRAGREYNKELEKYFNLI